jgi:hypothetical protein
MTKKLEKARCLWDGPYSYDTRLSVTPANKPGKWAQMSCSPNTVLQGPMMPIQVFGPCTHRMSCTMALPDRNRAYLLYCKWRKGGRQV